MDDVCAHCGHAAYHHTTRCDVYGCTCFKFESVTLASIIDTFDKMNIPIPSQLMNQETKEEDVQSELANIESALLTVAESIKYFADIYAKAHEEKPRTEDNYTIAEWRPAVVGDVIRLTGRGSDLAKAYTGKLAIVDRVDGGLVAWRLLDQTLPSSPLHEINNEGSRFDIMELKK